MRAHFVRTVADDPSADIHGAPYPCARLPFQPRHHLRQRINGGAGGSLWRNDCRDDSDCANSNDGQRA